VSSTFPVPPPELAARIGGAFEDYGAIGTAHRHYIGSLLPEGWSFANKRVLDFGCGTGRTLSAYAAEASSAEFWGCDIHEPSIEWASENLSPPFHFFVCREEPPFDQPDERFDLIYAMSVFTHITDQWSAWLTELHRVMRPGGIAIFTILGPGMAQSVLGRDWDARIGMAVVDLHKGWEIGGPSVFLGEWWIREHWGRAFEILRIQPGLDEGGHGFVAMRRREVAVTPGELEAVAMDDVREHEAAVANVELLKEQLARLGEQTRIRESQAEERDLLLAAERADLISERDRLALQLTALQAS